MKTLGDFYFSLFFKWLGIGFLPIFIVMHMIGAGEAVGMVALLWTLLLLAIAGAATLVTLIRKLPTLPSPSTPWLAIPVALGYWILAAILFSVAATLVRDWFFN